jgi:hypothetical protein
MLLKNAIETTTGTTNGITTEITIGTTNKTNEITAGTTNGIITGITIEICIFVKWII